MRTVLAAVMLAAACAPAFAQEMPPGGVPAGEKDAVAAAPAEQAASPAPAAAAEPAAPAVIQPAAEPAAQPAPAAKEPPKELPPAEAEWNFIKARGGTKDDDTIALLVPQLDDWLVRNGDSAEAAEALLLKARLRVNAGEWRAALTDLARLLQEYDGAPAAAEARKLFDATSAKELGKKERPLFNELARVTRSGKADRLAGMLEYLSAKFGADFYAPIKDEYRGFFNRFPAYAGNDILRLALADLHLANKEYLAASLAYRKLVEMHPASQLMPRAKTSLAATLAENLKEYDAAIEVYRDITDSYAGTPEAWNAYQKLPKLVEKQDKYELAVQIYDRIIALYPDKPEAFDAHNSKARVLREELKKAGEAIETLNKLADKYKGEKAVEALLLAAEFARKDLKDAALEVKAYDRIVAEYAADPQAPKALYAAGEAFEREKNVDKAREYYSKVMEKYADNSLAKKAQKRLDALTGK